MSTFELVAGAVALGVAAVFVVMFRLVSRRMRDAVPTATVVDGAPRWLAGRGAARMAGRADAFQRVAVAFGLTSIIVMGACLIGMIALAVIAKL